MKEQYWVTHRTFENVEKADSIKNVHSRLTYYAKKGHVQTRITANNLPEYLLTQKDIFCLFFTRPRKPSKDAVKEMLKTMQPQKNEQTLETKVNTAVDTTAQETLPVEQQYTEEIQPVKEYTPIIDGDKKYKFRADAFENTNGAYEVQEIKKILWKNREQIKHTYEERNPVPVYTLTKQQIYDLCIKDANKFEFGTLEKKLAKIEEPTKTIKYPQTPAKNMRKKHQPTKQKIPAIAPEEKKPENNMPAPQKPCEQKLAEFEDPPDWPWAPFIDPSDDLPTSGNIRIIADAKDTPEQAEERLRYYAATVAIERLFGTCR